MDLSTVFRVRHARRSTSGIASVFEWARVEGRYPRDWAKKDVYKKLVEGNGIRGYFSFMYISIFLDFKSKDDVSQ